MYIYGISSLRVKRNNIEGRRMDSSGSWLREMEGCCVHGNEYKIRGI